MGFAIGGPIVGAFSLTLLAEFLDIPAKAQTLVYASILILVIFYLRGGLVTLPQRASEGIARLSKLITRGTSHGTA